MKVTIEKTENREAHLKVEVEPEKAEPPIQLEAEAEVEPAAEPEAEEEISEEEIKKKMAATPGPPAGEEQGPLISEDQLVAPKPSGESLLEEFDREQLKEFEEGEAGAGEPERSHHLGAGALRELLQRRGHCHREGARFERRDGVGRSKPAPPGCGQSPPERSLGAP